MYSLAVLDERRLWWRWEVAVDKGVIILNNILRNNNINSNNKSNEIATISSGAWGDLCSIDTRVVLVVGYVENEIH